MGDVRICISEGYNLIPTCNKTIMVNEPTISRAMPNPHAPPGGT